MQPRNLTFRVRPFIGSPWLHVRMRVEGEGRNEHGNAYAAYVGAEKIGTIRKGLATFERRPKGSRVVVSRRRSLRWLAESTVEQDARLYQLPQETIGGAAQLLAESYARSQAALPG